MNARTNPVHLRALEDWLRSYQPERLFDEAGAPSAEILALCPTGDLRMGDIPQWDSLNHMAVIQAVEREFNLVFDLDDVVDLDRVGRRRMRGEQLGLW